MDTDSSKSKDKMKHTKIRQPIPKREINGRGKIDTHNTQIHEHSLSWFKLRGTCHFNNKKRDAVKLRPIL